MDLKLENDLNKELLLFYIKVVSAQIKNICNIVLFFVDRSPENHYFCFRTQ